MTPLQHYRQMAALSRKELAEKAGISHRTLQDYEQGRKRLAAASYETVVKVARILEVEPQELCPEV